MRDTPKFEVLRSVDQADGDWSERVGVVTVLLDDVNRDLKKFCGSGLRTTRYDEIKDQPHIWN